MRFPIQPPLRRSAAACIAFFVAFPVWGDGSPPEPPGAPEPLPGFFSDGGAPRSRAVADERDIDLDMADVREAQDAVIARQAHDGGEAWVAVSTNAFWRGLDRFHNATFLLLDNLVRTLDLSWTLPGSDYDVELSSLALAPLLRAGGRGNNGDFDAKAKVRVDLALPGLERRFHLVFDNLGRDSLPGSDPMTQESDWRLALNSGWSGRSGVKFELDGGLRLRDNRLVGFADAAIKWTHPLANGRFHVSPSVFYYTDRAWGQDVRASWIRWFGPGGRWGAGLFAAEENTDDDDSFDFEATVKFACVTGSAKNRGWVVQASVFPKIEEGSDTAYLDNAVLNLTWKSAVYRRWLYAAVTPQVDFAKEDGRAPAFSLRLGFEVLFGGEARPLM